MRAIVSITAAAIAFVACLLPAAADCGGCIRSIQLNEREQFIFKLFAQEFQNLGLKLCLFDDGETPNAHVHLDERPFPVHFGRRLWEKLDAPLHGGDGKPIDALAAIATVLYHELGHALMAELAPAHADEAAVLQGAAPRDGLIREDYADCIAGTVMSGVLRGWSRTCDPSAMDCAAVSEETRSAAMRLALDLSFEGPAQDHGTIERRFQLLQYGLNTATTEEAGHPAQASTRCLGVAVRMADAQLAEAQRLASGRMPAASTPPASSPGPRIQSAAAAPPAEVITPSTCAATGLRRLVSDAVARADTARAGAAGIAAAANEYYAAIANARREFPGCRKDFVALETSEAAAAAQTGDGALVRSYQLLDRTFRALRDEGERDVGAGHR